MDTDNLPELSTIWDEARKYIESGNHARAIEIYNYILVRYGDNEAAVEYAHAYLSDIYLTLRQIDLAEEHIGKALKYNPGKPDYHYILGFIYTYKRLWKKAIKEFGIALAKKPDDVEFIRGLGSATWMGGNREKGLALLHRANALAPKNVNVLTDLAVAYLDSDIDRARKYAEMAMGIEHGNSLVNKVWNKIIEFDEKFNRSAARLEVPRVEGREAGYYNTYIFRFKISLKENPEIWHIIEIKHNQMLSTLHKAIFKAFNRQNEETYSFFLSNDPINQSNEFASLLPGITGTAKLASRIRIDSIFLYLKDGQKFLYLFDYAGKVWHEVEFLGMEERLPGGNYPRLLQ